MYFLMLMAMFVIAWLLRGKWIIFPLSMAVTLLHEVGHAAMTLATGGRVYCIRVGLDGSGKALVKGGNRVLSLQSGYLGSIVLGSGLFLLPLTPAGKYSLTILGCLLAAIALAWVRDIVTIGIVCSLATAAFVFGTLTNGIVEVIIAQFVGVCCVLYAFLDNEAYGRNAHRLTSGESDAEKLAKLIGGNPKTITWCWRAISLAVLLILFRVVALYGG